MKALTQALRLSLSDYRHEALLSACSVFILAAVLAPLLVLLGVHHGIISTMTERLLRDPRTLEITPVGSGKYGPDWFAELRSLKGADFIMPQTRSIAATMNLRNAMRSSVGQAVTPLVATGPGDPLLTRWQQPEVAWHRQAGADGRPVLAAAVILAETTARKLGVAPGDTIEGRVDRIYQGRRESASLPLTVLSVLPPEAQGTDMMFAPLELLVASEDYRDGRAVDFLNWPGDTPDTPPAGAGNNADAPELEAGGADGADDPSSLLDAYAEQIRTKREYASFRLYAAGLDEVEPLWRWFQERHIEVYVRLAEIETVKSLDKAFTVVFALITGAALFGFCASTAGSALAGVRRKSRSLGLMSLMGFPRRSILLFPLAQTVSTGLLGFFLALVLYFGVAASINRFFAPSLPGGEAICSLPPHYAAAVLAAVVALSALSSLSAAWQATTIEPSEVIRDV